MVGITTTARECFTAEDSRQLAQLVCRRFGYELAAAAAAWRRMLQNGCSDHQFEELVGRVWLHEARLEAGLDAWSDE